MRRKLWVVPLSIIALLALALVTFGGVTMTPTNPNEPATKNPLSPDETIQIIASAIIGQGVNDLGDQVKPQTVYRWNENGTSDTNGRWSYSLIVSNETQTDICSGDFERNGAVRQTVNNVEDTLVIQVYTNTNCSEESYASVILTHGDNETLVANFDGKQTTEAYVSAIYSFLNT